jgi:aryl-alcohol dehydrogenase-like predicted oxidoreductase
VECGEIRSSVLGFGCGAVMGRVGRGDSLRAMEAAWEAGVTLFDTARSYGYGEAEGLLGEFLHGKRKQAVISTKFGIWPQKQSLLKQVAKPIVRAALRVMPSARSVVRRGAAGEMQGGLFTPAVLRASLEESLGRLKTDYVDLLFLHEGTRTAMQSDDLMAELGLVVSEGKVRRAGISADAGTIAAAIEKGPQVLGAMQFAANLFDLGVTRSTRENPRGLFFVANHPFGGVQGVEATRTVLAEMANDASLPAEMRDKLSEGGRQMVAEVIFGAILRGTGIHALVPSMLREENLRANVAAVESTRFTDDELELVRQRMIARSASAR